MFGPVRTTEETDEFMTGVGVEGDQATINENIAMP